MAETEQTVYAIVLVVCIIMVLIGIALDQY